MTRDVHDPIQRLWYAIELCHGGIPFDWMVEWGADGTIDRAWRLSRDPYSMVSVLALGGVEETWNVLSRIAAEAAARLAETDPTNASVLMAASRERWDLVAKIPDASELVGNRRLYQFIASLLVRGQTNRWLLPDVVFELTSAPISIGKAKLAKRLREALSPPSIEAMLPGIEELCRKG